MVVGKRCLVIDLMIEATASTIVALKDQFKEYSQNRVF